VVNALPLSVSPTINRVQIPMPTWRCKTTTFGRCQNNYGWASSVDIPKRQKHWQSWHLQMPWLVCESSSSIRQTFTMILPKSSWRWLGSHDLVWPSAVSASEPKTELHVEIQPHQADLDADDVVRGPPVILRSKDCHALWVSSICSRKACPSLSLSMAVSLFGMDRVTLPVSELPLACRTS